MEAVMTYSQAFFGWLLQTTLIASLVICLILLIQKMLGGKLGPRWSHALWLVLLIRMILPWSPSSRVSLSNLIPSWQRQTQSQQSPGTVEVQEVSLPEQVAKTPEEITGQETESELVDEKQVVPRPRTFASTENQSVLRLVSLLRILPVLWLAGAIVIGAYLLVSDLALWRIVKRDRPLVKQAMLELFEECKAQMGVQSLVVVVPSDRVRSPGLFGFIRPRLLLPREMLDTATTEDMRYVFLHELAHLRRHDIYLGWLTSLLQVLHWFNPLVWFAFYRMRVDRELACDALVLTRTGQDKSQEYGGAIVELVRRFSRSRPLPAMAGVIESRSQLKRRIAMITKFRNKSYRWSPLAAILIAILACISLPNAENNQALGNIISGDKSPVTLRRIMEYELWYDSEVSPDGKYICEVAWAGEQKVLHTVELATANKKVLVSDDNIGWQCAVSPDSKLVAYIDQYHEKKPSDLRLIGLDGSGDRVLCSGKFPIIPSDWSEDGSRILGWRAPTNWDGKTFPFPKELVWVSTENGSVNTITILPKERGLSKVDLSTDGRYIAYDARDPEVGLPKWVIFLFDIHEKVETTLEYPGNNRLVGWTPDGKHILFTSSHTNTGNLLLTRIVNGKPEGQPKVIKRNLGAFDPIGLTQSGNCYYLTGNRLSILYTAMLDLEAGQILSSSEPIMQSTETSYAPITWSPDGKHLTYCDGRNIHIKALTSGIERVIATDLPHFRWISWTPSGKSIIVSWLSPGGGGLVTTDLIQSVHQINIETGEKSVLFKSDIGRPVRSEYSPDEKSFIYGASGAVPHDCLVVRDLETGSERKIFEFSEQKSGWKFCWDLSPDGECVAIGAPGVNSSSQIKIISLEGKEIKELLPKDWGEIFDVIWAPDGQSVLFAAKDALWQISAKGGESRKLLTSPELGVASRTSICLHPDGQRIAYLTSEYDEELWVMENFLPEDLGK